MTPCPLPRVGRRHGVFAHEDAQVGVLAQLRGLATRGSAPSAALGRLEDGAPASRDRLRCWGSSPSAAPQQRLTQAPEDGAPASRDRLRCGDYLVAMLYYR